MERGLLSTLSKHCCHLLRAPRLFDHENTQKVVLSYLVCDGSVAAIMQSQQHVCGKENE
jgi:hypothetical protein